MRKTTITLQVLALGLVLATLVAAQEFERTKMYVTQGHKINLVKIGLTLQEKALVATVGGKMPEVVEIPYSEITRLEYEKSSHRRWKMGVLVSGVFLLSKAKKHWLGVFRGEDESVFQLSKRNYQQVLAVMEARTGKKIGNCSGTSAHGHE